MTARGPRPRDASLDGVDLDAVRAAAGRIRVHTHRTPVLRSRLLDERAGREVFLKAELFQIGGSHKARGSFNWFLERRDRDEPRPRGVVTASSGNHGQAVAIAARAFGVPAAVVMPANASAPKVIAVTRYGAKAVQEGVDARNREEVADRVAAEGGYARNHADDPESVAGFGALGLEIVEQLESFDSVVVPVGTAALIAGVAIAVKALRPKVRVIGVEPESAADARASLLSGRVERLSEPPATIADGVRALALPERTFAVLRRLVDEIVVVSEPAIVEATWLLWTRAKVLAEPTGALSYAAACAGELPGRRVVCVISGGNADVADLAPRFRAAGLT